MAYEINTHYFDIIDTEEKAYWIGFLWCDGYVGKRIRSDKSNPEYNIKLSLQEQDETHLLKFKNALSSTHLIHTYNTKGYGGGDSYTNVEKRVFITSYYMGKLLQDKYGLIPYRACCKKLADSIPDNLKKHFIRGVLDADGSVNHYYTTDRKYKVYKVNVSFTTYNTLLDYIESYFYKQGLSSTNNYKRFKRNEHRDGECRGITYTGTIQATGILKHLYGDANVFLDRKYERYQEIINNK